MRVMVTGAGGQLGRAVVGECARRDVECVSFVRQVANVADLWSVARAVNEHSPDVVLNCAAYTDVDGAEGNVVGAMAVNAVGAANVARALAGVPGARMVHVSTDYVFDGRKRSYTPDDVPHPLGMYGASKLAGEHLVLATLRHRATVVRTSWLYGLGGSLSFPEKALRWAEGKSVVRMDPFQRSVPTCAQDLAKVLVDMVDLAQRGVVHVVGGGGGTTRAEWARVVYEAAGVDVAVEPAQPGEFAYEVAERPACSVMKSDVELPDWRESTRRFVEGLP
jgi:dTDP-4-dehydrorhamnose reductase